jgi:hypothetical protein
LTLALTFWDGISESSMVSLLLNHLINQLIKSAVGQN